MRQSRAMIASLIGGTMLATTSLAMAETLTVVTAGDQNMVDYINEFLAPRFEAANPGNTVRALGTGPGDAGSQMIYERLAAQKAAGATDVDVDVAVVHQKMAGQMVEEGLLESYRDKIGTGDLVTRDTAKMALGIWTLLAWVPIHLGVAHQLGALVVLMLTVWHTFAMHRATRT